MSVGVTRNTAVSEWNLRGLSVNPAAGTNTINIVPSDSGIMFINKNTSANTNYVLPTTIADGDGKMFWFLNAQTSKDMIITAPANTLVADNAVTANSVNMAANTVGYGAIIVGDGSKYYLFELGALAWATTT